jgi:probable aminopeptidase NPEPL1
LLFPLIYCPEFLGIDAQFSSEVADMKNSVKDRSNAPSSGAGHFIEDHIVLPDSAVVSSSSNGNGNRNDTKLLWAHVDLAAPTTFGNGRGTGFGSSLLIQVANQINALISSQQ